MTPLYLFLCCGDQKGGNGQDNCMAIRICANLIEYQCHNRSARCKSTIAPIASSGLVAYSVARRGLAIYLPGFALTTGQVGVFFLVISRT